MKYDSSFKLPIQYLKTYNETPKEIIEDLELLKSNSNNTSPIYHTIFSPSVESSILEKYSKYYTTDISFLQQQQNMYKSCSFEDFDITCLQQTQEIIERIKNDQHFLQHFQFIDIKMFSWLNNNPYFLQLLSVYNLSSPVINLALPILFLIIPFFLLKLTNVPITFQTYKNILIQQLKKHSMGKILTQFNDVSMEKKLYLVFSIGFYLFNIYQNYKSCQKFYKNCNKLHQDIAQVKQFIKKIKEYSNYYNTKTKQQESLFAQQNRFHLERLERIEVLMERLPNTKSLKLHQKVYYIGRLMNIYYNLYENYEFQESLYYCFDLYCYFETINNVSKNMKPCKYNNKYSTFKDIYHPSIRENIVYNDVSLKHNIVITGPNASGKTTILKSVLLNLLLSQQIGLGFYKKASIKPYDYIHSYINIPDTNNRDSLFQAEARRCKTILDFIEKNNTKSHFCIFDELFSGTNPYEAISAGTAYIHSLNKNKQSSFMLTTHYIELCKAKGIVNKHMKINNNNNQYEYTYLLNSGISSIKGGLQVLNDLNFSTDIIDEANKILNSFN